MSLNIKNERVHDLARRAAEVTGKTKTGAIEEALMRLLDDYGDDPLQARVRTRIDLVHAISADYRADPGRTDAEVKSVDDLFDATSGMPS